MLTHQDDTCVESAPIDTGRTRPRAVAENPSAGNRETARPANGEHWSLINLVLCLSSAVELVSGNVVDHNKTVALIAGLLAKELGLPGEDLRDCVLAGLLHDIGALSMKNQAVLFNFDEQNLGAHCELGYRHISSFKPLGRAAEIVRRHHARWDRRDLPGDAVPGLAYLIHIADRIAVLIDGGREILGQADRIRARIAEKSGMYFKPDHVDAFMELSRREFFWFALTGRSHDAYFADIMRHHRIALGDADLLDFSRMIGKVIDFRCPFTAIHSCRVAAVAEALARRSGLDELDCLHMKTAGYLHDIGKLAVPSGIIEKPAALTAEEWNVVKSHPYHTFRLLNRIEHFEKITGWASMHHEQLNGEGYPFHSGGNDMTVGQRIMAVADIFTALMEDRPYRGGLPAEEALRILDRMAERRAIDAGVLATLKTHWEEIELTRIEAERDTVKDYRAFISGIDFNAL